MLKNIQLTNKYYNLYLSYTQLISVAKRGNAYNDNGKQARRDY